MCLLCDGYTIESAALNWWNMVKVSLAVQHIFQCIHFSHSHAEENFEAFNLLIILRLWRVVRIVNGMFSLLPYFTQLLWWLWSGAILSSKAQSDAQLEIVRGEARKTIHILHKLQSRFAEEVVREYNTLYHKGLKLLAKNYFYVLGMYCVV